MNFKEETLEVLKSHNKTWEDVRFFQGEDFRVANTKDEILEIMNIDYDCGFGGTKIAFDLVIVGDFWWLERHEYDGSEWWEYKELPKPLENVRKIKKFQKTYDDDWDCTTLAKLNPKEEQKE